MSYKSNKPFKDVIKRNIKALDIDTESWENLAADYPSWVGSLNQLLKSGEGESWWMKLLKVVAKKEEQQYHPCSRDSHIGLFSQFSCIALAKHTAPTRDGCIAYGQSWQTVAYYYSTVIIMVNECINLKVIPSVACFFESCLKKWRKQLSKDDTCSEDLSQTKTTWP